MSATRSSTDQSRFQHASREPATCSCPIHAGRDHDPFTAPLGLSFANDVHIEPISKEEAADVYAAHHGYMASIPDVNIEHHGIFYQNSLMGAITYRYPLISRKKVRFDANGEVLPEPISSSDIRTELPEEIQSTAHRIIEPIDAGEVVQEEVFQGDAFVEAARICLGVRMPNLASAALARSQSRFVADYGDDLAMKFLITFVRSDYTGSMIRALRDKGWVCTGWTQPGQASNRKKKSIRDHYKWRFCCPVESIVEQTDLSRWSA